MSWRRISALIIRHTYTYRRNIARLFDVVGWPVMEIVLWGFISLYLTKESGIPSVLTLFLGALILWEILVRSNLGITVSFLEDIWTKNQLNYFASPLSPGEYVLATMLSSLIRTLMAFAVIAVFAVVFYGFNVLSLGLPLAGFFLNLIIFGWSFGLLTISMITWFGQSAEIFAWAMAFAVQPFAAVFYPVSILPIAFQYVANALPPAHVFEGMRQVISTGTFSAGEFWAALLLNGLYLGLTVWLYLSIFKKAKKTGRLVRIWQ